MKKKTLAVDVDTRWDSTYLMLEAALPYQKVFEHFFNGSKFENIPTEIDWKNARVIKEFFKIFKETTKLFSGTKYVTSSTFCSQLSKIAMCLDKYSKEPSFKPLHKSMKSKYDKYWKHVPLVLGLASIMDPRIKISALDFCIDLNSKPSPENPPTQTQEHTQLPFAQNIPQPNPQRPPKPVLPVKDINFYLTKLNELFEVYQMKMNTPVNPSDEVSDMVEEEDPYYALLSQRREASKQTCKSDLQRYLDQPAIEVRNNKDFDVLKWWKMNEATYPILSAMARDLLAIPVSTVPSESAFSGSERIICKSRSSLSPDTVEALVCLGDWYKAEVGLQDEDVNEIEELMYGVML